MFQLNSVLLSRQMTRETTAPSGLLSTCLQQPGDGELKWLDGWGVVGACRACHALKELTGPVIRQRASRHA